MKSAMGFWGLFVSPCRNLTAMPAMDADHPLPRAHRKFMQTALDVARSFARVGHSPALLHRSHLRLGTHFSGMGGGELACTLVGRALNMDVPILSQCDVTPESLQVLWLNFEILKTSQCTYL